MAEKEMREMAAFPKEIKIPELVENGIIDGSRKALEKIIDSKDGLKIKSDSPDLIILPLRSAVLTAQPIKNFLEENQSRIKGKIPGFVTSAIGKIIPAIWADELVEKGEITEDEADEINPSDKIESFKSWISNSQNNITQPIIEGLKKNGSIKRVLVLDDAKGIGETLSTTAPDILKAAFGDIQVEGQNVLPDSVSGWEKAIIKENFPNEQNKAVIFFLSELIKGQLDARQLMREGQFIPDLEERDWFMDEVNKRSKDNSEYPMLPIESADTLRILEDITWQFNKDTETFPIVMELKKKYGEENLLRLPKLVLSSLGKLSVKL